MSEMYASVRSFPDFGSEYPIKCFMHEETAVGFDKPSCSYPFISSAPNVETKNGSSPNVSQNLGHNGFRPTSSTGSKFQRIPDALVSLAVTAPISLESEGFLVAANPML